MNHPRPLSANIFMVVVLGLGTAAMAFSGCGPTSEGRPAGSIEVKNARSSVADAEAAKTKVRTPPRGR